MVLSLTHSNGEINDSHDVLLVHEWLERDGGAEKVVDNLVEIFAHGTLLTLWNDDKCRFEDYRICETSLSLFPSKFRKILTLPLMPFIWRLQKTEQYGTVIVSSHLFAHHIKVKNARKFVYVHSPARYIWEPLIDERGNNFLGKLFAFYLKKIDRMRAKEAHSLAANSEFVAERIHRAWGCTSRVIYPPVESDRISSVRDWRCHLSADEKYILDRLPVRFLVGVSRLVPYKRMATVLRVANLCGVPAVIVGTGPELSNLKKMSQELKVKVIFLGRVSTELLYSIYQNALFLVFPPIEDFGIVPVEAMAAGCPVLGNKVGGVSETVVEGETGYLIDFEDDLEIQEVFTKIQKINPERCIRRAKKFDSSRFKSEFIDWVEEDKFRENSQVGE